MWRMIVYILFRDKPVFKTHTRKTLIVNEIKYVGISFIIINNIDVDSFGFPRDQIWYAIFILRLAASRNSLYSMYALRNTHSWFIRNLVSNDLLRLLFVNKRLSKIFI